MQADAGLIEHEERVHERRAEARREIHALHFATAQCPRRAVEREVAEADFVEVAEAGGDFGEKHLGGGIGPMRPIRPMRRMKLSEQLADGHRHQRRQRLPRRAEIQRRLLIPPALAIRAQRVAAVAAEQHADVHFVALRFQPVEEPLHPVPQPVIPQLLTRGPLVFAVDHPVLLGLRQLVERAHRVDVFRPRAAHEIALALRAVLGLERFHHPERDAQREVGERPQNVDADRPSEAAARGTRAVRMVEAEQARRRRGDVDVAVRAVPAGGEGKDEG